MVFIRMPFFFDYLLENEIMENVRRLIREQIWRAYGEEPFEGKFDVSATIEGVLNASERIVVLEDCLNQIQRITEMDTPDDIKLSKINTVILGWIQIK